MACPAGFYRGRMLLHVHVDGSFESELSVLDHDRILVLRDPVDGPVERPVENDAGCLTLEPRIVIACEFCRFLFSERRQLAAAVQSWTGRCTATAGCPASTSAASTCCGTLPGNRWNRAEPDQPAADTARIGH